MKLWMCKFVSRISITMELKKSCPRKYHRATIRTLDINIIIFTYALLLVLFFGIIYFIYMVEYMCILIHLVL
jgi:hypothetical protein